MPETNSHWEEPVLAGVYRADGSARNDPDMTKEENRRVRRIALAWAAFHRTGDRSHLVDMGILPALRLPTRHRPDSAP